MPLDGLRYAKGDYDTREVKPSSAFSKGDVLMLTSVSSVSRINPYAISTTNFVAGVALSESIDSIADKVVVLVPKDDTEFWIPVAAGSTLTAGATSGLSFVVGTSRYYAEDSGSTKVVVITAGVADCDQSTVSKVRGKILSSGGLQNFI